MSAKPSTYSRLQIVLHWTIAALVAFQIFFHGSIEDLWSDRMTGAIPNEPTPNAHAFVGLLIFVLALWRVWIRVRRGAPELPVTEHPLLKLAARVTHGTFYVLLIGMPIVGALAWFGGYALPGQIHYAAAILMIILILVHVAAALTHRFLFRTDVMRRMLTW